jgi:phosphoenolpyruvate synthase/pyruvate phosphate dikinase
MLYLKTLPTISPNELQAVGYRGQDLAFLASNQMPIASSFVVLSNAYDEVVRLNNLKYKFDYIMSHAQENIHSTLVNAYSGVRKAMLEAKFPPGMETELKDLYESISSPVAIGELTTERLPVRVIVSMTRLDDPENNDTIIQNVNSYEELLTAVREAFALVHHPSQLGPRMREKFPDSRLKVALIVQVMEEPVTSCHAYSALPQDHKKIYLQTYYGQLDVRNKITKDYYAISKESFKIVASHVRDQPTMLERDEKRELVVTPLAKGKSDKVNDRELIELGRLTKKAERLLQTPVKIFFSSRNDTHDILWINRLGFDVLIGDEAAPEPAVEAAIPEPVTPEPTEPIMTPTTAEPLVTAPVAVTPPVTPPVAPPVAPAQPVEPAPIPQVEEFKQEIEQVSETLIEQEDFIVPEEKNVSAKLLSASMKLLHQTIERKYKSMFADAPEANLAEMISKLNDAFIFSRPADAALLLQAEEAAKSDGSLPEEQYTKTIEEITFLLSYA